MPTEKEILEKYPEMFREKDLPMTETCMCWGLEVPDRWLPIIDQLCGCLQNYGYTSFLIPERPQVVAEQVKSKWGQLRFYYRLEWSPLPDKVKDGLDDDEEDSKELEQARSEYARYVNGMITFAEYQIDQLGKQSREEARQAEKEPGE